MIPRNLLLFLCPLSSLNPLLFYYNACPQVLHPSGHDGMIGLLRKPSGCYLSPWFQTFLHPAHWIPHVPPALTEEAWRRMGEMQQLIECEAPPPAAVPPHSATPSAGPPQIRPPASRSSLQLCPLAPCSSLQLCLPSPAAGGRNAGSWLYPWLPPRLTQCLQMSVVVPRILSCPELLPLRSCVQSTPCTLWFLQCSVQPSAPSVPNPMHPPRGLVPLDPSLVHALCQSAHFVVTSPFLSVTTSSPFNHTF